MVVLDTNCIRYKARLVVKGFSKKEGIDYSEIFSPVVKMTSIRVLLSIVAVEDLHLEQLDVKTAFLYGDLDEELYMAQPKSFEVKGKEHMVCRLKKSLYGLKQAPRQWYFKFDGFMQEKEFAHCESNHCVYFHKYDDGDIVYLSLYMDDILVASSNMKRIVKVKKMLSLQFAMKDLGEAKNILVMKIIRDKKNKKLWLSQEDYVNKVLKRFNMDKAKLAATPLASHFKLSKDMCLSTQALKDEMAVVPYASAVENLMYAMVSTRPDIAHAMGVVSRYMQNPGREHCNVVKWILRYLAGTSNYSLCYGGTSLELQGYVDANHSGDRDSGKSTTGYIFTVAGTTLSWVSQLQKVVALSTTEAEYVAIIEASKEIMWLQDYMEELHRKQPVSTLWSDSQSAVHLAKNAAYHSRTRHIKKRYHFIRSALKDNELKLQKIDGSENPTDMMTNVVDREKHIFCTTTIGITPC